MDCILSPCALIGNSLRRRKEIHRYGICPGRVCNAAAMRLAPNLFRMPKSISAVYTVELKYFVLSALQTGQAKSTLTGVVAKATVASAKTDSAATPSTGNRVHSLLNAVVGA